MEFLKLWANLRSKFGCNYNSLFYGSIRFNGIGPLDLIFCRRTASNESRCTSKQSPKKGKINNGSVNFLQSREINYSEGSFALSLFRSPISRRKGKGQFFLLWLIFTILFFCIQFDHRVLFCLKEMNNKEYWSK